MDRYILSLFHLDGRISVLRSVGIIDLEQCGIVASAICGDDVQIADLVEIAGAGTGHGIHDDRFGHNHAQGDRFPSSDCGLCGISSILSHDEMQSAADRTLRTKNDMQVLLLMARYLKIQVSLHRHTIRER